MYRPPHTPRADMESALTVGVGVPDDPRTFIVPPTSRSGQDRALQTARLPQPVGRGLDPSVAVPATANVK